MFIWNCIEELISTTDILIPISTFHSPALFSLPKEKVNMKAKGFRKDKNYTKEIKNLRIPTGKKLSQMKLPRFRKVGIWIFAWLAHQINSLYKVLKLKQNFRKNKIVAGKTGPFCTPHSICLHIGF